MRGVWPLAQLAACLTCCLVEAIFGPVSPCSPLWDMGYDGKAEVLELRESN